ncbi:MAG: hypothetical protein ABL902_07130 [Gallionella sp.]
MSKTTSHSTKPASGQVAGYPVQTGIQLLKSAHAWREQNQMSDWAKLLDSRLHGNDDLETSRRNDD